MLRAIIASTVLLGVAGEYQYFCKHSDDAFSHYINCDECIAEPICCEVSEAAIGYRPNGGGKRCTKKAHGVGELSSCAELTYPSACPGASEEVEEPDNVAAPEETIEDGKCECDNPPCAATMCEIACDNGMLLDEDGCTMCACAAEEPEEPEEPADVASEPEEPEEPAACESTPCDPHHNYYFCSAGTSVNGCRPEADGPFPESDCSEQCSTTADTPVTPTPVEPVEPVEPAGKGTAGKGPGKGPASEDPVAPEEPAGKGPGKGPAPEACTAGMQAKDMVCSNLKKIGRFDSVEECAAAVLAQCDYTDNFNFRERNGACLCSQNECATKANSLGIDVWGCGYVQQINAGLRSASGKKVQTANSAPEDAKHFPVALVVTGAVVLMLIAITVATVAVYKYQHGKSGLHVLQNKAEDINDTPATEDEELVEEGTAVVINC